MVYVEEILDPDLLSKILVSPRTRAQKTCELLFAPEAGNPKIAEIKSTYEGVREWTYGDFEGALVANVNKERRAAGKPDWDIVSRDCCVHRRATSNALLTHDVSYSVDARLRRRRERTRDVGPSGRSRKLRYEAAPRLALCRWTK